MSTTAAAVGVNQGGMAPDVMLAYLRERLEDRLLDARISYGQLKVTVAGEAWLDAARLCKQDPRLDCAFFDFLSGIDRGADGIEVIVHLYSPRYRHEITLTAMAPGGRQAPVMPSLTGVYRGANWHERETYDMLGVDFDGHPGVLPRILTVENFEGWPLRKEFLLSTREAKPWPGAKEPEERHEDGQEGATPAAGHTADAGSVTAADAPVTAEDKAAAAKAKAERAKAKAAAMRARKAAERAEAQGGPAPAPTADPDTTADEAAGRHVAEGEGASVSEQAEASAAQMARDSEAAAAGRDQPGGDLIAEAADRYGGGDTEAEGAGIAAAAAGEPEPQTPEGAAEIAGSGVAKDAAAGAAAGDMAARAPQDAPGAEQPVLNPEGEVKAGQGAPPSIAGSPGPEAEGRHGGAEQQSGAKPAAETPGMTSATQDAEPARGVREPPAPGPETNTPGTADQTEAAAAPEVPTEPAPGSEAPPLAEDRPAEEGSSKAGLDTTAKAVSEDDERGPRPEGGR